MAYYSSESNVLTKDEAWDLYSQAQAIHKDREYVTREGDVDYETHIVQCVDRNRWSATLPNGVVVSYDYEYDNTPGFAGSEWDLCISDAGGKTLYHEYKML